MNQTIRVDGAVTDAALVDPNTNPDGNGGQWKCTSCIAGTYKYTQGLDMCMLCEAGKYSAVVGNSAYGCTDCAPGTRSGPGWTACEGCDAGSHPNAERTGCNKCEAGTQSPGNAWCTACGAGKQINAKQTGCDNCGNGQYSAAGASCAKCAAGSVANSAKSACDPCDKGKYADGEGWHTCLSCAAGSAAASTGNSVCTKCLAGKYANEGPNKLGSTLCESCETNTYAPEPGPTDLGNQKCTTCDVRKYTQCAACGPLLGASKCFTHQEFCVRDPNYCGVSSTNPKCHCCSGQLLANRTSVTELAAEPNRGCDACADSQYMDENAHKFTACKTCVEGRYPTRLPGADAANAIVPVGLGIPGHGPIECVGTLAATSCSSCSAGGYKAQAGYDVCVKCAKGRYSAEPGASTCVNCRAGTYAEATGVTVCTNCVGGKYSGRNASTDALSCTACPALSFSEKGSSMRTDCICNAGYEGPPGGNCTACSESRYKSAATGECLLCGPGKFAAKIAATACDDCTPGMYKADAPDGWDQIPRWAGGWACTSHPGVWVRFPNERNQCVLGRLVHTGLGSSSLVAHVLPYPPPPTQTALY
jgi:hypothetical protein